jgi:hypothetical protein
MTVSLYGVVSSDSTRSRLLLNGGQYPSSTNIEYIELTTFGNGASYGNLTISKRATAASGGRVYGLNISGYSDSNGNTNRTDRITFLTLGAVSSFLDVGFGYSGMATGNQLYGFTGGAWQAGTAINRLAYSTSGTYTFIGNLVRGRSEPCAASSPTRGVWIGGGDFSNYTYPSYSNMDYINFSTTGNATTFGTLSESRKSMQAGSSATRMLYSGGWHRIHPNNFKRSDIQYLTFSTTGNGSSFGNMSNFRSMSHGGSNDTVCVFATGYLNDAASSSMEKCYISSLGNSVYFADVSVSRQSLHGACTNSHGGLR